MRRFVVAALVMSAVTFAAAVPGRAALPFQDELTELDYLLLGLTV